MNEKSCDSSTDGSERYVPGGSPCFIRSGKRSDDHLAISCSQRIASPNLGLTNDLEQVQFIANIAADIRQYGSQTRPGLYQPFSLAVEDLVFEQVSVNGKRLANQEPLNAIPTERYS
ncbi:MAG: hypothetical protein HKN47_00660, partial [Pirellulaceae bacterium]|nr:hypothetical protein [Pirellulaceae bacterium]